MMTRMRSIGSRKISGTSEPHAANGRAGKPAHCPKRSRTAQRRGCAAQPVARGLSPIFLAEKKGRDCGPFLTGNYLEF